MSPVRMERVESGVRTMIAFTEAVNRHDLAAMMDLVSDNCVFEDCSIARCRHQDRGHFWFWSPLHHAL
jgi:ketosteroid isomerase-like protein